MPPIRKPRVTQVRTKVVEVPTSAVTVAVIPDKRFAKSYVHRSIKGVPDFDLFDVGMLNGLNILIEGPTGPGKTSAYVAYAAERAIRFYAIPSNVAVEPSQLFGKAWNDNGVWQWIDGGVTDIIRNGGLLVINEINFLPDRIATVLFSALDFRREITLLDHKGETVRAHRPADPRTGDGCWCDLSEVECRKRWVLIAADMNEGYAGTRPLNEALRNRFAIQVEWGYDPDVERQLVVSPALRNVAADIRTRTANGEWSTPLSTNMLVEFESLVRILGLDFAIGNFVQHYQVHERPALQVVMNTAHAELLKDVTAMKTGSVPAVDSADADDVEPMVDPFDFLDHLPNAGEDE